MTFKWKIKGFDNYLVSIEGYIFRKSYITKHLHYKNARFISPNGRNQFRLWRNGNQEIWSKRQLRNQLISIDPVHITTARKVKGLPF